MSVENMAAAWNAHVPPEIKLVLLAVADTLGDGPDQTSTFHFASIPTVARRARMSEEQARQLLVRLGLGRDGDMGDLSGTWLRFADVIARAETEFLP